MHEIYCDWSPIVHWKSLISATRLRPQINLWIAIEVKEITSISVDVITISWNSLRSYATPMTRSASPDGLSTRAYEASFLIGQCKLSGPFEVVNGIREDPTRSQKYVHPNLFQNSKNAPKFFEIPKAHL